MAVPPIEAPAADLTSYPAVRLFLARATAVDPDLAVDTDLAADADLPAIAQICRSLDGLPLAIELAAARTRLLSPPELLARMTDRFAVLNAASPVAPTRQRTLKATVDWSWQLVTAPEQVLLRRFAVFAGGATLDAVEQVCAGRGVLVGDVLGLMGGLVERSLIATQRGRGGRRYAMLQTIQAYARQQLATSGETEAVELAHASH